MVEGTGTSAAKRAFVIMPFDEKFDNFYQYVIKPTVEECGYKPIFKHELSGPIMEQIYDYIAQCEICIVVMTDFNWNVAYELGVRHAFAPKGTFLLLDESQKQSQETQQGAKSYFDVQGLNILFYPEDWDHNTPTQEIRRKLAALIKDTMQGERDDSPAYSKHPIIAAMHQKRAVFSQQNEKNMTEEEEAARERRQELTPNKNENKTKDRPVSIEYQEEAHTNRYLDALMNSVVNSDFCGNHAVAQLVKLQSRGDKEKFVGFLAEVMKNGHLNESQCQSVADLCAKFADSDFERIFLEYAFEKYGYDGIKEMYARLLVQTPGEQKQAIRIVNELIGLTHTEKGYHAAEYKSDTALSCFCDVYISLGKYADLLEITKMLATKCKKFRSLSLVYKTMAACCLHLEDQWDAFLEHIQRAIHYHDTDSLHDMCSVYYREEGIYSRSYCELEHAIYLNPKNGQYYLRLGGMILSEHYARTSLTEQPHPIDRSKTVRYALPYLFYPFKNGVLVHDEVLTFLYNHDLTDELTRFLSAYQQGDGKKEKILEAFSDLDFTFVEYAVTNGAKHDPL